RIRLRCIAPDDYLFIQIRPTSIALVKKIGSTWTTLDSETISTTANQWYTLRAEYVGANATVWRSTEGALETPVLTTAAAEPLTTTLVAIAINDAGQGATAYQFDNVRVLADDLSTT